MNKTTNQAKKNKNLGSLGEKLALQYLLKKGYSHMASNYQGHWGELDLVMKKGSILVFIEVKTRKNPNFGSGEEAVDIHKKRKLFRAIHQFIENNTRGNMSMAEWQLDLITIEFKQLHVAMIRHFENILEEA